VTASPDAREETTMAMGTFVNLPVQDLARSRDFFTKIGFSFNEGFSDPNTACSDASGV